MSSASSTCVVSAASAPGNGTRFSAGRNDQSQLFVAGSLAAQLAENKRRYCAAHGYRCLLLEGEEALLTGGARHPSWAKVIAVNRSLEGQLSGQAAPCEWTAWVDTDSVFVGSQPLPTAALAAAGAQMGFAVASTGLNAGVFLMRRGGAVRGFLRAVWARDRVTHRARRARATAVEPSTMLAELTERHTFALHPLACLRRTPRPVAAQRGSRSP